VAEAMAVALISLLLVNPSDVEMSGDRRDAILITRQFRSGGSYALDSCLP
jgi:hypothetical protein